MIGIGLGMMTVRNGRRGGVAAQPPASDPLQALKTKHYGAGGLGLVALPLPQIAGVQNLFQDEFLAVPTLVDGDPVRTITDASGNGNVLISLTSAARGTYRTDGTYHWIDTDGSDDGWIVTSRDSMKWATHNAANAARYTSYYALQTMTAKTANSLGGFAIGNTPVESVCGDFFRASGELVHRAGNFNDAMKAIYTPNLNNASFITATDNQPGFGARWHLNGVANTFKSETAQGPLSAANWGLMIQGNGGFPTESKFYGSFHHEGAYDPEVFDYLASLMPPLDEFTL